MNEAQIFQADQTRAATNLIEVYLADMKPHPAANLVRLVEDSATTPTGGILFGVVGGKAPKTIARAVLVHMLKAGDCVGEGEGKKKTVKLKNSPKWVRGKTKPLRDAEAAAKAAIFTLVDQGGGRLITQIHTVFNEAVQPKLTDISDADGIPEGFLFAFFRRVLDLLIEEHKWFRYFAPHGGEQIECISKVREKKKPTVKKENADATVAEPVSEAVLALHAPLTAQDQEDYRRAALGVSTSARSDRTLAQAVAGVAPVLADAAWASASESDRKRFLAEQLAAPETAARVREMLVGTPKVAEEVAAQ